MNKTVKSIEKMLSGTHCKLCLCVLLVGMILYILNRFTFRNAEGFLNPLAANGGFSSRAENEYRRVKMKYGRKKLEKMGLDPSKYSEDFIFALKIILSDVSIDYKAHGSLLNAQYDKAGPNTGKMENIQSPLSDAKGHLFTQAGKFKTASIALHEFILCISYKPSGTKNAKTGWPINTLESFKEAKTLYENKVHCYFIIQYITNNTKTTFSQRSSFGQIHGFGAVKQGGTLCVADTNHPVKFVEKGTNKACKVTASNSAPARMTPGTVSTHIKQIDQIIYLNYYSSTSTHTLALGSPLSGAGKTKTTAPPQTPALIGTALLQNISLTSLTGNKGALKGNNLKNFKNSVNTIIDINQTDADAFGIYLMRINLNSLNNSFVSYDLDIVFELISQI